MRTDTPGNNLWLFSILKVNVTLALFLFTMYGYIAAILFEYVYLSAYGVAFDAVQVYPTTIFQSLLIVIAIFTVLELATQFERRIRDRIHQKSSKNQHRKRLMYVVINDVVHFLYVTVSLLIVGFFISGYFIEFQKLAAFFAIGTLIGLVFSLFNPLLFRLRLDKKQRKKTLELYFKKFDESRKQYYAKKYAEFNVERLLIIFMFLSYSLSLVAMAANGQATMSREYLVVSSRNNTKQLLIRQYDDLLITKAYDTKTSKFIDGYAIQKIQDSSVFQGKFKISKQTPAR